MNKQKKRAISRGKFERVRAEAVEQNCWDNSFCANDELAIAHNGFIYWTDHSTDTVKYFRKSIKEALS